MKKILLTLALLMSIVGYSQVSKTQPISAIASTSVDEYFIYVPNSFTPNGDGLNDIFRPAVIGQQTFQMTIYDRWSEVLYKTNDPSNGWDGTYKGNTCKENAYVWEISTIDIFGIKHYYIGYVIIINTK